MNRSSILGNVSALKSKKVPFPERTIRERLDDFTADLQAHRRKKLAMYYHTDTVTKIYFSEQDGGGIIECFVGRMDFLHKFKKCVGFDPTANLYTVSIDKFGTELGRYECKWGEGIYICEWIVEMQEGKPVWTKYRGRIYMPAGFKMVFKMFAKKSAQITVMPTIPLRKAAAMWQEAYMGDDNEATNKFYYDDTKTIVRLCQEDAPFGEDPELVGEYVGKEQLDQHIKEAKSGDIIIETMKSLSFNTDSREIGMYTSNHGEGVYYTKWIPANGAWQIYRTTFYLPRGVSNPNGNPEVKKVGVVSNALLNNDEIKKLQIEAEDEQVDDLVQQVKKIASLLSEQKKEVLEQIRELLAKSL